MKGDTGSQRGGKSELTGAFGVHNHNDDLDADVVDLFSHHFAMCKRLCKTAIRRAGLHDGYHFVGEHHQEISLHGE